MDPTPTIDPPNPQSNGTEENPKRPLETNGADEPSRSVKRRRFDPEVKRVAEIVLVLSAMGSIRGGGNKPSDAEVELMVEARRKLAGICEGFAPKDVVSRDAVGRVIEDLGLARDRKLGFCGPSLSIAEKLEVSKRKMEETKKFDAQKAYTSQSLQANVSASASASAVRGLTSSRLPGAVPYSSGSFSALPGGHVSVLPAYQTNNNEVKTSISSSGIRSSHLGRESSPSAVPRVEGTQFKVEGGKNGGTIYSSQVRASSPANQLFSNAPPWGIQSPSASSSKSGLENKGTNFNPVKVTATNGMSNMSSQAARDQAIRPFIAQNTRGSFPSIHQTLPGTNIGLAPSPHNHHSEIARTVQNILHPNIPERPSWTPPSKDYMNNALTCQICKLTTNEVSTVLVCDSCEKGYHIKCIQFSHQNGVPRGEWHCQKCLDLSNGKPLPPKYGRVARSTNTPKVPSSTGGAQVSQEKKVAALDPKVAQQKITANGNSAVIQSPTDNNTAGLKHVDSASVSNVSSAGGVQLNNKSVESCEASCGPSVVSSAVRSSQHNQNLPLSTNKKVSHSESKSLSPVNPLSPTSSEQQNIDQTQIQNSAEESSERSPDRNLTNKCPEVCYATEHNVSSERSDVRREDQGNEQESILANTERSGPNGDSGYSAAGLQAVEWVGDVSRVVDGKQFYQSCCINGVIYNVGDYALFSFRPNKSAPSKLLAMWQDSSTKSKWFSVRKCYFPGDLPEIVGRPYTSGSNEVFESNQDSILLSSSLQGPCGVLTAAKFEEEIERRTQLETDDSTGLKSIFLCKWLYDEVKGTFQPSSS